MQMRTFFQMIIIILALALIAGCASTPKAGDATPTTVFEQPIERVQKAAVDALIVTGFEVKKQESTYVEGFRPRKVGLVVGSGGETVGVWLTSQGPNKTGIRVDTAKSLVGVAGQKNWNNEILYEMTKTLSK
jgi:hypothetical protein